MPDKCIVNPEQDCLGIKRADEVAGDIRALDRKLTEFQQAVADTNGRFGSRIGKLEAREEVREEQYSQFKEKLGDIARDMAEFKKENRESIVELRKEHRESMDALKKGNQTILDAVTPLKHKVETLEQLSDDVEKLKEKPGETWEHIKKQGLGWLVALALAILAVALGLGKYL